MIWSEVKVTQSVPLFVTPWNIQSMEFPRPETGENRLSLPLLQVIFPTQGSNPGLLHCRWILYQLSHKGSPKSGLEMKKLGVGMVIFLQPWDFWFIVITSWNNSLSKTSNGGTLHPPSDVCIRSFLCHFHSLIKLCYTKAPEWSSLVPCPWPWS